MPTLQGFQRSMSDLKAPVSLQGSVATYKVVKQRWYNRPSPVQRNLQNIEERLKKVNDPDAPQTQWIQTDKGGLVFGLIIFLNGGALGLDIQLADSEGNSWPPMLVAESVFLLLFWLELCLRMRADGIAFWKDPWGPFDFMVTFLGSCDAWILTPFLQSDALVGVSALRTLRLLRLMRLLRVFRVFSELASLVRVLAKSVASMVWSALLIVLVTYVCSILTLMTLKPPADDPYEDDRLNDLTTSLTGTMYAFMQIITCEGYIDTFVYPTWGLAIAWVFLWVALIVVLNFFMVNLMVGIIVQRTLVQTKIDEQSITNFAVESEQFRKTLLTLFTETANKDQDDMLDVEEFQELLDRPGLMDIWRAFGIKTDLPRHFLVIVFGFHEKEKIDFEDFYSSCIRICGSNKDIRTFMLQVDVSRMTAEVMRRVQRLSAPFAEMAVPSMPKALATTAPAGHGPRLSGIYGADASPPDAPLGHLQTVPAAVPLGGGFPPEFLAVVDKVRERLGALEQQQEEMLAKLVDLRVFVCGRDHCTVVRCSAGHPLLLLGMADRPAGPAIYRNWTCDGASEPGGCSHGSIAGSHISQSLRRYHCATCRYDLCEQCHDARVRSQLAFSCQPSASGQPSAFKSKVPPSLDT